MGQDALKYVSPGQTAELRVTRSLDVSADYTEEETGARARLHQGPQRRRRVPHLRPRDRQGHPLPGQPQAKTAIKVRIRKAFTGEWVAGDGNPEVNTTAAGLRQPNPTGSPSGSPPSSPARR